MPAEDNKAAACWVMRLMNRKVIFMLLVMLFPSAVFSGVDFFNGQLSGTAGYNNNPGGKTEFSLRYIPETRVSYGKDKEKGIDAEMSLKAVVSSTGTYGSAGMDLYRLSLRYFTPVFEARFGLQKINFGPARIFRSLMWFDRIDPRDPFGITSGVTGMLLRYYMKNNSNIWAWFLVPGNETKGLEAIKTDKHHGELGARAQVPVEKGEVGISFNGRYVDLDDWIFKMGSVISDGREMKVAFDGSWDLGIGLWFEAALNNNIITSSSNMFTGFLTAGADYTLGNCLFVTLEQFFSNSGSALDELTFNRSFTGILASYPVSVFDNVNAIIYYDWMNNKAYLFAGYQRTFDNFKYNLMVYTSDANTASYISGNGVRFIVTYNH